MNSRGRCVRPSPKHDRRLVNQPGAWVDRRVYRTPYKERTTCANKDAPSAFAPCEPHDAVEHSLGRFAAIDQNVAMHAATLHLFTGGGMNNAG